VHTRSSKFPVPKPVLASYIQGYSQASADVAGGSSTSGPSLFARIDVHTNKLAMPTKENIEWMERVFSIASQLVEVQRAIERVDVELVAQRTRLGLPSTGEKGSERKKEEQMQGVESSAAGAAAPSAAGATANTRRRSSSVRTSNFDRRVSQLVLAKANFVGFIDRYGVHYEQTDEDVINAYIVYERWPAHNIWSDRLFSRRIAAISVWGGTPLLFIREIVSCLNNMCRRELQLVRLNALGYMLWYMARLENYLILITVFDQSMSCCGERTGHRYHGKTVVRTKGRCARNKGVPKEDT
jgi:hypothetical protein